MSIFSKPALKAFGKKRHIPEGLWHKCPACGEVIHDYELARNQRVCQNCHHHFTQKARERIQHLLDPETFIEADPDMTSADPLNFSGPAKYAERLQSYQEKTGLKDSVISGEGKLEAQRVSIAVMDFSFLGASMGSVAGEKITRAIETATRERLAIIIISASGGARLYEGMFSLLQMAKTCGALAKHSQARLPFISVLTNPTTGGVMASFASVGDIIMAEPKSMIGFAGPRVIRETTHQDLPPGFQTAEFLQEHGLVDMIVPRQQMRQTIARLLRYLLPATGQ